mgnify:CR=1 FL=1
MGMDLPKAPEGYFWDSYLIRAPKGAARVTQLRKKVFWVFSKPVGNPKAEVVVFDDTFPNTVAWAEDLLREVKGK